MASNQQKPGVWTASPPPKVKDPRDELPDSKTLRDGLTVRPVQASACGEWQAYNPQPWEVLRKAKKITARQESAAIAYAERAARFYGSPAPKSCIDIAVTGYDEPEDTEKDEAAWMEWKSLTRAIPGSAELEMAWVFWQHGKCRNLEALQAGLDAVADFLRIDG